MTDVVATTSRGGVIGARASDGLRRWLGVPFARARRGGPPEPVEGWSSPRDATTFGAACPQPNFGDLVPGGALGALTDEQCLFANVWAPEVDGERAGSPWPVLVWVHGGSFLTGAASQAMYDGAALARRSAVVVSVNYRVGPFGFLAPMPELAARGWTANCGLHDVVAALRWVRDEIGAFGGNPANVTVFGESAGAGVIAHLLGAPGREALFDRAIMQSASAGRTFDEATAALVSGRFLDAVGGTDALFDAPAEHLVDVIGKVLADPVVFGAVGMMPFHPSIDGVLVYDTPAAAVATGAHAGCDLLVSVTRDEMCLFLEGATIEPERLRKRVARYAALTSDGATDVIARYADRLRGDGLPCEPIDVWGAIYSDREMTLPARRYLDDAASHHDAVFAALFDWTAPARRDGRPVGAAHAIDLPFTFASLDIDGWRAFVGGTGPRAAAADRLAAFVGDAWVAFARDGNPGWSSWSAGRGVQRLGEELGAATDPIGARAALWEGLG